MLLLSVLVFFRLGDIASLQVEAVVNPTNESLTDKNPISQRLNEVAGPELKEECRVQVGSETIVHRSQLQVVNRQSNSL